MIFSNIMKKKIVHDPLKSKSGKYFTNSVKVRKLSGMKDSDNSWITGNTS